MTVVVIGSSGGGTATLGHTDAQDLLTTIHTELKKLPKKSQEQKHEHGVELALFVSASVSMDSIDPKSDFATLWTVGIDVETDANAKLKDTAVRVDSGSASESFRVTKYYTGLLSEVNQVAKDLGEKYIVSAILAENSPIQGIICISCDPKEVNCGVLSAAAQIGLPITGSGGTSLSAAMTIHKGLSLVGNAGGSVATTTYTRAVSYCFALAKHWELDYTYSSNSSSPSTSTKDTSKPRIGSILDACLPSFLAVCITCHIGTIYFGDLFEDTQFISQLQFQALPSVCSVVAATSLSPEHGSTAVMASVIASMACHGSILAGLLAGWIVSCLLGRALFMCIRSGVPATMTNIVVAGFVGSAVASFLCVSGAVNILSMCTDLIRTVVRGTPNVGAWDGSGFGFLFGCIFCYGSKVGWYHSIFLPVILIEMEQGKASMWGSVDECVLVLVSAGICAANLLVSNGACELSKRGLKTNILCGDFIEVAYPYMERSKIVNISAYLASGISTEILYQGDIGTVMSSAYLPLPLSIFLAHDRYRITLAIFSAFVISFVGMLLSNVYEMRSARQNKKSDKHND